MAKAVKPDVRRFLANVPEEFVFWCNDGRVLRNLLELKDALTTMSDETYTYHVNAEKNDFANWVKDIIGDTRLANDLRKARSREEAARIVARRLAALK